MSRYLLIVFSFLLIELSVAQEPLITNINGRETTSLNGEWNYIPDLYLTGKVRWDDARIDSLGLPSWSFSADHKPQNKSERVEYDFDHSPLLTVPGDWNHQRPELLYYEGSIWYKRDFDLDRKAGKRYFIHFGAVNYQAEVYVNNFLVGRHEGGFTPFNFEITDVLQDDGNYVVVRVDNERRKERVPALSTDWWNYGGITRDVNIIETASAFVRDYQIQLSPKNDKIIDLQVEINGLVRGQELKVVIPELKISKIVQLNTDGKGQTVIDAKKVKKWSPEIPKLYDVELRLGDHILTDQIGFRTITTDGPQLLLNGKPLFLRGICMHEENPFKVGRITTEEEASMMFGWVKELEANMVRLAHYTHSEATVRLADRLGILLWTEVPVYWSIDWENQATEAAAQKQLTEMIMRDKNRASIIIWSIGNETPRTDRKLQFMSGLAKHVKALDPTRLTSAALFGDDEDRGEKRVHTVNDPLGEFLDIISFNEYVGWYWGGINNQIQKYEFETIYDKPLFVSELGAGALHGFHGDSTLMWSEEFQQSFYENQIKILEPTDKLCGLSPWILTDFRSPRRLHPVFQNNWNRKGLISDNGQKKNSFFVLRDFYKRVKQGESPLSR
ncbi:MAG: beta-glucuronidase [Cyclobacteriaceae bacterium]|nr:beta-glucuronidase [Cyclobacteriaceae bacterium HetDA_MAG_MS6]